MCSTLFIWRRVLNSWKNRSSWCAAFDFSYFGVGCGKTNCSGSDEIVTLFGGRIALRTDCCLDFSAEQFLWSTFFIIGAHLGSVSLDIDNYLSIWQLSTYRQLAKWNEFAGDRLEYVDFRVFHGRFIAGPQSLLNCERWPRGSAWFFHHYALVCPERIETANSWNHRMSPTSMNWS